jgi:hypothetical protein
MITIVVQFVNITVFDNRQVSLLEFRKQRPIFKLGLPTEA